MDKEKIMSLIADRKKYATDLENRANQTVSSEHKRAIGETLKAVRDEINDLEKQLESQSDDSQSDNSQASRTADIPEGAELRNADVLKGTYTGTVKSSEGLALRSDETMVSRVKGNTNPLDIGKIVRGLYNGNWDGAEAERRAIINTQGVGTIIPAVCSAQIIDMARNISLFGSANVPVYPMESDNLKLARLIKDPVFSFKAEGTKGTEADFELDDITLESKTCYGYAYVSIEAIESAKNLGQIISQSFAQAMANSIDVAMLYGQAKSSGSGVEDFAPAGIMNDVDINVIEATNNGYTDYIKGIGAVRRANGTPTVLGMNADTEELISLLTDKDGQPLKEPKAYEELKKIVSNQLKFDSSNGSDAIVFDPQALAIGIQNNIRFRMITDSDECIQNGLVGFQIYSMLDCKAVRPKHISKITGIKENATV